MYGKNIKRAKDFKEAYPDVYEYLCSIGPVPNPFGRIHPSSGKLYRGYPLKCHDCNCDIWIDQGNIWRDQTNDGLFRCRSCAGRLAQSRQRETMTSEEVKDSYRKRKETLGPEGARAAAKKGFDTRMANGTSFRSEWEPIIDREYGSIHYFDGYFEIDCYFPDKKLGIEIDTPDHDEGGSKPRGYHYDKDKHYKDLGIKILHLTTNPKAPHRINGTWKDLVEQFLNGTYEGPLIDLTDETYGDIVYEEV